MPGDSDEPKKSGPSTAPPPPKASDEPDDSITALPPMPTKRKISRLGLRMLGLDKSRS